MRRPRSPPDPDRPVAIIFTSGTTGLPKGAVYCNRQLAFITQTDVGDTWDGGGRSFSGTSFAHLGFMTKLPGSLRRGGTTSSWNAGARTPRSSCIAREHMTTVAGVPTQLALMLRDPDFDDFDLSSVRVHHRGRRSDHARARRGSARAASAPSSRRATRAPKPASGSAPRSTIPKKTRS